MRELGIRYLELGFSPCYCEARSNLVQIRQYRAIGLGTNGEGGVTLL